MKRALVGTLIGFLVGAPLGGFLYSLAYKDTDTSGGKTIYYPFTTAESTEGNQKPWFSPYAWSGVLLGGGLGSITGSVVGAAGATVAAIKEATRPGRTP